MRIIAGTARSLPLKTVEGLDTRPTTDRIKETLFNIIQDEILDAIFWICLQEADRWDLRQSAAVRSMPFLSKIIKKAVACVEDNIRFTKFTKETKLYNSDVLSALRAMEGKYRFDIIFMDPPYKQELEYDVLSYLKDSSLLKENGIIIVEASLDTAFDYLPDMGFTLKRLKTYKTNEHAFIIKNQ